MGKRAPNAQQTLNLLYRTPVVTAQELEEVLKVSKSTVHLVVRDLLQLQILVEQTGQHRGKVYAFEQYISLFSN